MRKTRGIVAIAAVTLGLAAASAYAQDPVAVCPKNFKVLAEDEYGAGFAFHAEKR